MASVNAMNFRKLSRRDDLISLTYLLIYMIQGHLSFMVKQTVPMKYQFGYVRSGKIQLTPCKLCNSNKAKLLVNLIKEINSLEFDEKPDYKRYRKML